MSVQAGTNIKKNYLPVAGAGGCGARMADTNT